MQSTADINQQMQTPLCEHNVPCVLRSVTKEGPTHGMKFFSCDKAGDAKCNFFQWVGAPLCKVRVHQSVAVVNRSRDMVCLATLDMLGKTVLLKEELFGVAV
jgi:hypothetical protein